MIVFENPGLIDETALTTQGVSVKKGDSPIGEFGTGVKIGIAVILRNGGRVSIWRGKKELVFDRVERTIRGETFNVVTMNGKPLGFTDRFGPKWQIWMAYREFWSNCRDEAGTVRREMTSVAGEPRRTKVVVSNCPEFERCHDERHKIVLQTEPLVTCPGLEVHAGRSGHVFYRGIRVSDVPNKRTSLYTYCLTNYQTLTEDRTLAYQWGVPGEIAGALVQCTNESILEDALSAKEGDFEFHLPWKDQTHHKPSPQFMIVAERLRSANRLTGSALQLFKSFMETTPGYLSPYIYTPSRHEEAYVREALEMLSAEGIHFERTTIKFKTDRKHLGTTEDGGIVTIPAEDLLGGAINIARVLLVFEARRRLGGGHAMAHRILTGAWPEGDELNREPKKSGETEDISL